MITNHKSEYSLIHKNVWLISIYNFVFSVENMRKHIGGHCLYITLSEHNPTNMKSKTSLYKIGIWHSTKIRHGRTSDYIKEHIANNPLWYVVIK